MDLGIAGRRAIVCASSKGLGRGCAEALAREGVDVVINGRNEAEVMATAKHIRENSRVTVTPVVADVSTEKGREALLKACSEPDILINNAGGPDPNRNQREDSRMFKRFSTALVLGCAMFALAQPAQAQSFPTRPITIIVPFAAGGPTDIVARVIAVELSTSLGQQAVVENVVGAAGTVGMVRAARVAPDGHTLLLAGMSTMSFSPTIYPNLPVHSVNNLDPVGIVASAPIVLVVSKDLPVNDVKEFAAHAKAQGDKLVNGHAGVGSSSHLACALLNARLGIKPNVVPYKGTAPAMNDMIAGQVHYLCDQTTSVMAQVRAGGARALAVMADQRSDALPGIPTISEAGFAGAEMVLWNALFAPKGTPKAVIKQINAAISKGVDAPAAKKRFGDLGAAAPTAAQRSPDALRKILADDIEKWGKVIREAGIKPVN